MTTGAGAGSGGGAVGDERREVVELDTFRSPTSGPRPHSQPDAEQVQVDVEPLLPAGAPGEPDWSAWIPDSGFRPGTATAARAEATVARTEARRTWRRVVPALASTGLLAEVDEQLLIEHCVTAGQYKVVVRRLTRDRMTADAVWLTRVGDALRVSLHRQRQALLLSPKARESVNLAGGPSAPKAGDAGTGTGADGSMFDV